MQDAEENPLEYKCDYESVDAWSNTIANTEETFSHRWTIHEIKSYLEILQQKPGFGLKSSVFLAGTTGLSWHAQIRTEHIENLNDYQFCIDFHAKSTTMDEIVITNVIFDVLDTTHKSVYKQGGRILSFNKPGSNTCSFMITTVKGMLHTAAERYREEDQLRMHFRVSVQTFSTEHYTRAKINTSEHLLNDYKGILKCSLHHDVIIITDSKQELKANKNILSARSPVFAAMFEAKMTEANQSEVVISEFEDKIIKEMLEFIYSGKVDNLEENAIELLKISDIYDIKDLKEECVQIIPALMTIDNVVEILQVVAKYNDLHELKRKLFQFISRNKGKVKNTTGFQNLEDPDLLKELIANLHTHKQN